MSNFDMTKTSAPLIIKIMLENENKTIENFSLLEDLIGDWNLERFYDNGTKVIGIANFKKINNT
jgi:hypothetical protein